MITKNELIEFENEIEKLFEDGKLPYPIHFSGGNENQLLKIFRNIKKRDWIFSTHRSHYHYLLKGGDSKKLKQKIACGNSISIMDQKLNFLSSGIVAGCCAIAVGVSLALKREKSKSKVFCFIGDAGCDEGHFYEAARYVEGWNLPCTFIVEDNGLSVDTPKKARYGKSDIGHFKCIIRYKYKRKYPHVQTGKLVSHYM